MIGTLTVGDREYCLAEAELHMPLLGENRWMYLVVAAADGRVGFGLWDVEFTALTRLEELDGKRMHVRRDTSAYDDDTLGTDIAAMYETTDINYLSTEEGAFDFEEIQLDFEYREPPQCRCRFRAVLTADTKQDPNKESKEACGVIACAEFTVRLDENDPSAET